MIILGLENKSSTAQLKVHYLIKYASLLFSKRTGNTDTLRRKGEAKVQVKEHLPARKHILT